MTRGALWKQRHGKHRLVDNLSFSIAGPDSGPCRGRSGIRGGPCKPRARERLSFCRALAVAGSGSNIFTHRASKTTSSGGGELTGPPELGMQPTLTTGKGCKVVVTPSSHAPSVSAEAHQRAQLSFPSFLRKQTKHSTECNHDRPSSSCLLASPARTQWVTCINQPPYPL